MVKLWAAFVLALLPLFLPAQSQCTFCLPFCTQPPFPGNYCSDTVVLSVRAKVLSNSTTVCTSVCDGKGIALGNLKTVYKIKIKQVFKGARPISKVISVAGIRSFSTEPGRMGVNMSVKKTYFINLLAPRKLPGISTFLYVDRCDRPVLWRTLTKRQKRFLRKNASNGQASC